MSLLISNEDIVTAIWDNIETNQDMVSLRLCCKTMYNLTEKYGYIKHLELTPQLSYVKFIQLSIKSNNLQSLLVSRIDNPIIWIPFSWPKKIVFNHCHFNGNLIVPPNGSCTEELHINSNFPINFDFSKLPELKIIDINTLDMNTESLIHCKKLEIINIYLKGVNSSNTTSKKQLPTCISKLSNLKILNANLEAKDSLHFVSNKLIQLIFYKKKKCTTESISIPSGQLEPSHYYF